MTANDSDAARELRAISNCNQALLRATDEQALLKDICHIVCDDAGYRMAWVGFAEHDEARSIHVAAADGEALDYLDGLTISWADVPEGQGPTGVAIRTGQTVHIASFADDPMVRPWRERALAHGFACSIALPLKDETGTAFGALTIYSAESERFEPREIGLLEELAGDLGFGIRVLRARIREAASLEELRTSEEKFSKAFETSPAIGLIIDVTDMTYSDVNAAWEKATGFKRSEVVGKPMTFLDTIDPEVATSIVGRLREAGVVMNTDLTWRTRDGSSRAGTLNASLIEIAGRPHAIIKIEDVTDRLHAERSLRESERLFRSAFIASPDPIVMSRVSDGQLIDVSDEFVRVLGYRREDVVGRTTNEIGMWTDSNDRTRLVGQLTRDGILREEPVVLNRADGSEILCRISASLTDINGEPGVVAFYRDVTAQTKADAELREYRERMRATFEQAAAGIVHVGLDGRFIDVNQRFCDIVGRAAEELHALSFADLTHPDDLAEDLGGLSQLKSGEIDSFLASKRYLKPDGSSVWVELASALARNQDGEPDYIVSVIQDVTERRLAEDALENKSRALRALSRVNEELIRATDEQGLLDGVCSAVADQGYPVVWAAYLDEDLSPNAMSVAGKSREFLALAGAQDGAIASFADGRTPMSVAVRESRPVLVHRDSVEFRDAAAAEAVERFGIESALALPLLDRDGMGFGALNILSEEPDAFGKDEFALLAEMASDLSYGIESLRSREARDRALHDLRHSNERLQTVLREITETMGKIVETRDPYTQGHQQRVAHIAGLIAAEMGLSAEEREMIEDAALVHDVGKLSVPAEILNKPGRLSDLEFTMIKEHSATGYEILRHIDFEWPIAEIVLQHHERVDGSGYPNGLSGDQILMPARVLMVADVVEAIASHRPYRAALGIETAVAEITAHRAQFDGSVVDACLRLYERLELELEAPAR